MTSTDWWGLSSKACAEADMVGDTSLSSGGGTAGGLSRLARVRIRLRRTRHS